VTPIIGNSASQIALLAKAQWGYPERWTEIWTPLLTITPEFISSADVRTSEANSELAGFYALIFVKQRASLEHLWILPAYIGQGIGRALFEHALARCRDMRCQGLEIVSDPNARGFYERMGAKKVGVSIGEMDGDLRSLTVIEIIW